MKNISKYSFYYLLTFCLNFEEFFNQNMSIATLCIYFIKTDQMGLPLYQLNVDQMYAFTKFCISDLDITFKRNHIYEWNCQNKNIKIDGIEASWVGFWNFCDECNKWRENLFIINCLANPSKFKCSYILGNCYATNQLPSTINHTVISCLESHQNHLLQAYSA